LWFVVGRVEFRAANSPESNLLFNFSAEFLKHQKTLTVVLAYMRKRKSIKSWLSPFFIFIIFLITISFTIDTNYKSHFEGSPDCFKSIGRDSICNLVPLNYRVYPAGMSVKHKDSVSRIDLLKAGKLESEDKRFEIISFRVGIGDNCLHYGMYTVAYCNENIFSDQATALINLPYKKGGPIYFDCIAAKTKAGKIFRLMSVTYWLKD